MDTQALLGWRRAGRDRLSTGEARIDRGYKLALAAQAWAARPDKASRAAVDAALADGPEVMTSNVKEGRHV